VEPPSSERGFTARPLTVAALSDWGRTGATVVAIVGACVTVIRWTATVDDRLGEVEQGIKSQRAVLQEAAETTAGNAASAAAAATRAEAAVVRAEAAVNRAESAVDENRHVQSQIQGKITEGQTTNRQAIDRQGKKVDALKVEVKQQLEALAWRVRQLEEESRKAQDKAH